MMMNLLKRDEELSREKGILLNAKKTKIMAIDKNRSEGTPEEVAPQICSDEEIVVPRKRSRNQRTIPIWRPSSSRPTADVSSQPEPEQSDQQGTSKTIQEITDEYVASQAAIPTNKTNDISRMERSIVQSFDRRVMDPEVDTYLGDQRYWKNRKKDRAPPKQCNRALAKTSSLPETQ